MDGKYSDSRKRGSKLSDQRIDETEQACMCAAQQAAHDLPYVHVGEVRPYHYHYRSGRWYIEVDLQHGNPDEGAAVALYRVWKRSDGSMAAVKIDIVATESEN
jgi:hypothetical protein